MFLRLPRSTRVAPLLFQWEKTWAVVMPRLDLIPNPGEGNAPGHCFVSLLLQDILDQNSLSNNSQFFAGAGASLAEIGMGTCWRIFHGLMGVRLLPISKRQEMLGGTQIFCKSTIKPGLRAHPRGKSQGMICHRTEPQRSFSLHPSPVRLWVWNTRIP